MNRESLCLMKRPFSFEMPKASLLDRLADAELQLGHTAAAERLSAHAEELRENAE